MLTFFRNPFNLVSLILVPFILIEGMGYALGTMPELPGMTAIPEEEGRIIGALFSTAFLTGLMGLFQVINAREGDRRLNIAGAEHFDLLTVRIVTILILGALVSAINYAVLLRTITPESHLLAFAPLISAGMIYGFFGVLIGAVLPKELEASLVMVFLVDMDVFLGSGVFDTQEWIQEYFPLHHSGNMLREAVVEGTYTLEDPYMIVLYLFVLFILVSGVFYLISRGGFK